LLIESLKFDLRIYVLLYGINPLRVYVYDEGLARFATVPYEKPDASNHNNMFMHLTIYAINKQSSAYVPNDTPEGRGNSHKRSLTAIYQILEGMGHNSEELKKKIDDLILKTLIAGQPEIANVYKACQPEDYENSLCFQILGFDVMIDSECKPWLIEVNHAPSFATESGFDHHLKSKLIENTFRLLNLSPEKKNQFYWNQRLQLQKRILTGKIQRLSPEEKEQKRKEYDEKRNRLEQKFLGNYRMIYPNSDMELVKVMKYERLQEASRDLFEYFTMGKKKKDYQWKSIKDAEQLKAEKLPPWRRTGG
jgi:tubulin polyglutamylase TTLL6/13